MKHWAVSVDRDGQNIVTIESNCLSGRNLSAEDEETILGAAQSLLSFIGQPPSNPSLLAELQPTQRSAAALREALRTLVEAGDFAVSSVDDVAIMLRLGQATDTARALLADGTETP